MLRSCVEHLEEIEQQTGRCIHLDIEPEPGCRLQKASDLSEFIHIQFGDDEKIRRYIRVCHDTCHSAVMRETAEEALAHYNNAGLKIGKVQLSSAIQVDTDDISEVERQQIIAALHSIAEPRYLHQTTIESGDDIMFFDNLPLAPIDDPSGCWRIHFHVPIHKKQFGVLQTSQDELLQSISILKEAGVTTWEVETYTWDVMPSTFKEDDLIASITKELLWAAQHIQ